MPGPAIITALAQAAQKAITAYNTSVSTDISASPAGSVIGAEDEEESDDDDLYDEEVRSTAESVDEFENYRNSRKQSVVSVSTTISTKTETISPQPDPRASLSRHASSAGVEDEENDSESRRQEALDDLGPPPFYRSLLLLAQMSSADNLFIPSYTAACVKHARENKNFVMGFIAQESLNQAPGDNFITMTPGVQKAAGGDGLGQQYNTPRKVIVEAGADIIIVGRGVLNAVDRRKEALEYRKQGWLAYQDRIRVARNGR